MFILGHGDSGQFTHRHTQFLNSFTDGLTSKLTLVGRLTFSKSCVKVMAAQVSLINDDFVFHYFF